MPVGVGGYSYCSAVGFAHGYSHLSLCATAKAKAARGQAYEIETTAFLDNQEGLNVNNRRWNRWRKANDFNQPRSARPALPFGRGLNSFSKYVCYKDHETK